MKQFAVKRLIRRVMCMEFGHSYHILQAFSHDVRRIQCARCGGDWGMNDSVPVLLAWDAELEDLERSLGHWIIQPKFSDGSPIQ
jgi:hypothetical protein